MSPVKQRLARILDGRDFPALSQQIIDTISVLDDDASSLQRLANVVLREYSLTLSVIRTANSAHYRRSGRPIQSATHAMLMLGAKTVRHLASSLLLFENYTRKSPGLKELMLLSLLSANHAREVAARLGNVDPEEAHLCGMFRNLGEVLIACHFPEDYARIHAMMRDRNITDSAAARLVLEFRYEDLGEEVSLHWGMPDSVRQGIRARASAPTSPVGAITSFSHDLTNVIYRRNKDGEDAQKALDDVIARHASHLKLPRDHVREVVEAALSETRELFVSARVSMDSLRVRQLSQAACSALGLTELSSGRSDDRDGEDDATQARDHSELRERLRQELEGSVGLSSGDDLGQVLLLALEGALRGGPFDRVVACVLNADRTRLRARSGLGANVEALMTSFDFPMTARGGPVAVALLQRQPLYLPVMRDMNRLEMQFANACGIAQFGVFPIIVAGKLVGCLYCDRTAAEPVPSRNALTYVQELCALVVKGIDARRRASASTSASGSASATTTVAPTTGGSAPAATTPTSSAASGTPETVSAHWNAELQASIAGAAPLNAESKGALVLRLLQGEDAAALAQSAGVDVQELERWRAEFLAGALARLSGT